MLNTTDYNRTNIKTKAWLKGGNQSGIKSKTMEEELRYLVPWEICDGNKKPEEPRQSYEYLITEKKKLIHRLTNINQEIGNIKSRIEAK